MENNTEHLRDWFRTCPAISRANRFRVDYLAEDSTEYALYSVPSAFKYRENILGEEIPEANQVQNFIFASKAPFGADIRQNLDNLAFFQSVTEWIIAQNAARVFPEWDGGTVKSIVPTLTAYPAQVGASAAKYQIQIRISYRRE